MTKKDGVIIRWLARRNAASIEALSERFSLFEIRGAFKRGLIKMNEDRTAYRITKQARVILNKDDQPTVLCVHCLTYNLKYDHHCSGCQRMTSYRKLLDARIKRRQTTRISGADSEAETRRELKQA